MVFKQKNYQLILNCIAVMTMSQSLSGCKFTKLFAMNIDHFNGIFAENLKIKM